MNPHPDLILFLGIIFFLGLASDILARRTAVPRVTFLILIGIVIGPAGIDLLPQVFLSEWFDTITTVALGMIGFLLGQQFTLPALRQAGAVVFAIALGKVLMAFVLITAVLILIDVPVAAALILGSIASATAPAAIYEVVHEMGIVSRFSKTLLAVIALDDILAMLLFSLVLAGVGASAHSGIHMMFASGLAEIFGSLLLGYVVGYPVAKVTGRVREGEPSMVEAMGSVFLICGLAQWLDLSPILAAMAMGSAVTAFATHHARPFHEIDNIQWLFMILFFLFAGASLRIEALQGIGLIGLVYIVARIAGFYLGARLGAKLSRAEKPIVQWMGWALIPQAGVAIGMALVASQEFEAFEHLILPVVLSTTVVFEVFGPMVTRYALKKSQDAT